MRTFNGSVFEVGISLKPVRLGQTNSECVLIGTLSHKADSETLFDRTEAKYEGEGWTIVREKTGQVLYAGTKDEVEVTNIWACPPEPENKQFLGQVKIVGSGMLRVPLEENPEVWDPKTPRAIGDSRGRMTPYNGGPAFWNDNKGAYVYCDPAKDQNCPPGPTTMTREMGQVGPHWARYGNERLRWPDCDPRYDANCPFPTQVITEQMDAMGVAQGFGGPGGGGFGFHGGPGGMVGPVAGSPSPASGPITGPSIPCGPAGGPTCPPGAGGLTVIQNVYPINGVLGRRALGQSGGGGGRSREGAYPVANLGKGATPHGRAAEGKDEWYHPDGPCPPGYFRSSPGSPCVSPGNLVDNGEDYFGNPWV